MTHPTRLTHPTRPTSPTRAAPPNRRLRADPVRIGALYDLAVAPVFATPWTAGLAIDGVRSLHTALGLPGRAPGEFAPEHLLFVTFFGVLVTMWAVVRLMRGDAVTAAADTAGRAAFALLMMCALAAGATPVLVVFLVVEVGFLLAQGWQLIRARRASDLSPRETVTS
ncbi:hypothetical protein OIE63_24865 [Streptomyces sp. NBC_01795]|uniref:hypothetical protein n=1 Tax=Streptomyces sp. NBC_01795 TaxID=2975943 RepID=UPI002DDB536E|nr:hypothetical protein [Streptomyces sp. NBC_01795]WSA94444.1 hypothetical protein OIE63_24865 [Streptomyces sp. NBC_01795]